MGSARSLLFEVVGKDGQPLDVFTRSDLLEELELTRAPGLVLSRSFQRENFSGAILIRVYIAESGAL
jgi:hypothetical protein